MAEVVIVGSDGNVSMAGAATDHNAKFNRWSATVSQTVTSVAGFQDAWEFNRGGIKSLRGSASGDLSQGTTDTEPNVTGIAKAGVVNSNAGIVLTIDSTGTTSKLSFDGVVSSAGLSSELRGRAGVSYDFVATGAVTEAWVVA